ncbi:hypothetical protein J6524_09270 [Bradyrhizobium sp. WSM 1738]|uniref:hypothetical protein n=1 Tax=Bradyrhizobium hereditatis TaxID=2821405 RepID=UPI001CE2F0B6|nr:hypothetical protein [Bradyrhizobium hereditatis]MCA6115095.1 hypothetical protein [Bradyrhizobium hereditatis]
MDKSNKQSTFEEHSDQGQAVKDGKWHHGLNREDTQRAPRKVQVRRFVREAALDSVPIALRALILINCGAGLAVLSSLEGVATRATIDLSLIGALSSAAMYFALGAALAFLAMFAGAAAEMAVSRLRTCEPQRIQEARRLRAANAARICHVCSFTSALASLALFASGMAEASSTLPMLLQR